MECGAREEIIFGQCTESVPTQNREEFGFLLIYSIALTSLKQVKNGWGTRRTDHTLSQTVWMIIQLCLWTSEREVSSRFAGPECQLAVASKVDLHAYLFHRFS